MFALLRMILIFVFGSLLFAKHAEAAEITCVYHHKPGTIGITGDCLAALLSARIVKGDYEKVAAMYAREHPHLLYLFLQSPGGDVEEAIKIGRLVRKYLITAAAPSFMDPPAGAFAALLPDYSVLNSFFGARICSGSSCICASACALIWFGAPQREDTVRLHRPYIANPRFKDLSPALA